ncbi:hypothetical protein TBS_02040 [Thermobispora bispora]|nr:hypothetical protein [Actinomycetales bacterium]
MVPAAGGVPGLGTAKAAVVEAGGAGGDGTGRGLSGPCAGDGTARPAAYVMEWVLRLPASCCITAPIMIAVHASAGGRAMQARLIMRFLSVGRIARAGERERRPGGPRRDAGRRGRAQSMPDQRSCGRGDRAQPEHCRGRRCDLGCL